MIDPTNLEAQVRHLTEGIGPRLAGSTAEKEAANYVAETFARSGAEVRIESFPVRERRVDRQSLRLQRGSTWEEVPCSLLNGAPGTGGREVEAPLVVIEPPELDRPSYEAYTGKAILLLGTHIENPGHYQRLMEARPAFLLLVDVRYPSDTLRADGLFPSHVHRYGAVPTVAIPYGRAWELCAADRASLCVSGGSVAAESQNVVALLPGKNSGEGPMLFASGHHDTQADCPGADDNGSGVATILELARVLAPLPRLRDICLISFGAEEQLSVGSASFVRTHREALSRRGGFTFNFDSFGSKMGWHRLDFCAEQAAAGWLTQRCEAAGQFIEVGYNVIPYQDAFPLHVAGIPGCWLSRRNCTAGVFYHHQSDDRLAMIDVRRMAAVLQPFAAALAELASAESPPIPLSIPEPLQIEVQRTWKNYFGGWDGFNPEAGRV